MVQACRSQLHTVKSEYDVSPNNPNMAMPSLHCGSNCIIGGLQIDDWRLTSYRSVSDA